MSFDLHALVRRRKPEKRIRQLAPRPTDDLLDWRAFRDAPPAALLLDTNVYIKNAARRLPSELEAVINNALLFHSSVALSELATGLGNLDPREPRWRSVRDHYAELIKAVPQSRLLTPDAECWIDAGLIAGILARTQGFQRFQRKENLNDALIYLTAAKAGLQVLTSNRTDFDLIQQVAPGGQFICY